MPLNLHHSHPNLFYGMITRSLTYIVVGGWIATHNGHSSIGLYTFIWVELVLAGLLTLYGAIYNVRIARFGLIIAMVTGFFLGMTLLTGLLQPIKGVQAILWIGMSILTISMIAEPSSNPMSALKGRGDAK